MDGTRRGWNEAGLTYYGNDEARSIHEPWLGWQLLWIAAVVVPVLLALVVIFWFIREYISPPMAIVQPASTLASHDAASEATAAARREMDAVINSAASPILTPSAPPPRPQQVAVPMTRAPAFAEEAQSQTGASSLPWAPIVNHAPLMSTETIEARPGPLAVPLPRRRPVPMIALADPSDVPLPRNRPAATTEPTAPDPDPIVEKPDRNF